MGFPNFAINLSKTKVDKFKKNTFLKKYFAPAQLWAKSYFDVLAKFIAF
jgi:hypothetical protein